MRAARLETTGDLLIGRRRRSLLVALLLAGCAAPRPATDLAATPPAMDGKARPPALVRASLEPGVAAAARAPGLAALERELARARATLAEARPPAYFIAYRVHELRFLEMSAIDGAIDRTLATHRRWLDTEVRVGERRFDSSRPSRSVPLNRVELALLPREDDAAAIAAVAWRETDRQYKAAAQRLSQLRAQQAVRVEREDSSDDFTAEKPVVQLRPFAAWQPDVPAWQARLRRASARFAALPALEGEVGMRAIADDRWVVTSEGTVLQLPGRRVELMISARLRTGDGAELTSERRLDSHTLEGIEALATDDRLAGLVDEVVATLRALAAAPLAEPYVGPAIFEGGSAAVLFHEALGHRSEGSRLHRDQEDHTFASKVGVRVMPAFLSVFDDPTARKLGSLDLVGHYLFDDDGVPAERVTLVEAGVFKGFLLGRTPVKGFSRSNGHGRGELGRHRESRMANLVVEPSAAVPPAELRRRLLDEVRRRGLDHGLRIRRLSGGETILSRGESVLRLELSEVYRVFADGRPDQLVRGANLSGTPLAVLGRIEAATDRYEVFNGGCGANDSGWVPQSNTSPDLLVSEVEIVRKPKGQDRPPVLPPPPPGEARRGP